MRALSCDVTNAGSCNVATGLQARVCALRAPCAMLVVLKMKTLFGNHECSRLVVH